MTETEDPAKAEPETAIGVDLGLSHAVVTSEGEYFDYPGYYSFGPKAEPDGLEVPTQKGQWIEEP